MTMPSGGRADLAERFRRDGFVVLRAAIDPEPLLAEVRDALHAAFGRDASRNSSAVAGIAFRYVPTMSNRTPLALDLLDRFAPRAAELAGRAVLPVRAKATEYHGASSLHRDSTFALPSVGFLAYLEAVTAATGALRVVPGSHQPRFGEASEDGQAVAIETEPGDVVVIDEHVVHGSVGGAVRHQWRVDFVARPSSDPELDEARRYYGGIFSPDWDGGYDVDTFPSFGPDWRARCAPDVDAELARLGVYEAAQREEDAARERRSRRAAAD